MDIKKMDIKKEMDKKRNQKSTSLHFLKLKVVSTDLTYCFVEGEEDITFYQDKLSKIDEQLKYEFIKSDGKEKILKLEDIVNNKLWSKYKIMLFVDKDYDNTYNYKNIFVTDVYSIENYFVTNNVLEKILKYSFYIDNQDVVNSIIKRYEELQIEYHKILLKINTFLKLQQIKENTNRRNKKLHLNQIKIKDIVEIKLSGISLKKDLKKCMESLHDYYEFNKEEFIQVSKSFETSRYPYDFRGKYEIHFLENYLELIVNELKKDNNIFKFKKKITYHNSDFIRKFTMYAESPKNLKRYVKYMINAS